MQIADIFQSTLSMRRATKPYGHEQFHVLISIHALHEESDNLSFLGYDIFRGISIHALHEESDDLSRRPVVHVPNFNPRSP